MPTLPAKRTDERLFLKGVKNHAEFGSLLKELVLAHDQAAYDKKVARVSVFLAFDGARLAPDWPLRDQVGIRALLSGSLACRSPLNRADLQQDRLAARQAKRSGSGWISWTGSGLAAYFGPISAWQICCLRAARAPREGERVGRTHATSAGEVACPAAPSGIRR